MKSKSRVLAVVGAQYGSEAKGSIVAHIANSYDVHVRTGGPNAGHTIYHNGEKFVMQTIPCGWVNPAATVIIGRGALVDLPQLIKEIEMVEAVDHSILDRLIIDSHAGIISKWHYDEEGGVQGEMHKRIGSTGKGVGAARRDRVMRDPDKFQFMEDVLPKRYQSLLIDNTPSLLNRHLKNDQNILLEGAQGSGLSNIHGPWPYVTSADTNAAQLAADAGLPPQAVTDVLLVARTYPIRVAGNSGPLEGEMTWEQISERMGRPTSEQTTVTKKTRRIGAWDEKLVAEAMLLNGASQIAINFMDYLAPEDESVIEWDDLSQTAKSFVEYVELRFGVTVPFVGTSATTLVDRGIFRP